MQKQSTHASLRSVRWLRTIFAGSCMIAGVLVFALWIRSYSWTDMLFPTTPYSIALKSQQGQITVGISADSWVTPLTYAASGTDSSVGQLNKNSWQVVSNSPSDVRLLLPHWFFVFILLVMAVVPWVRLRFSLRTVLERL